MQALEMTGNWFAVCAILGWPIVALFLYRTRPIGEATVWTILGAYLLLPTGVSIKLEMLPALDKNSVPNFCALIGCIGLMSRRRSGFGVGLAGILVLMLVVSPVVTAAFNNDTLVFGERVLPGVGYYDGISSLLLQLTGFLTFLIGRRVLRDSPDFEMLIRCLVVAGLLYSLPVLIEVRLSPQLANWIYGFVQGAFTNEVRYGGFRPVVFMKNGLTVAFFVMTTFLAAMVTWRLDQRVKSFPASGISGYLGVVLILCKSAGALAYAIIIGLFVRVMSPRVQLRLAVFLVTVGLLYPVLRMTDFFPDTSLVELATSVDQERAKSLKFRFDQERQLLDHASQRFVFGWGRYGRNRVYEESGKDSSVTDGAWIQIFGQFGLVGFLAQFGLLVLPVFRAAAAYKHLRIERERIFLSAIALIVALGVIEQLPNSSISPWSWLLAGALLGRADRIIEVGRKVQKSSGGLNVSKERRAPVSV